jgi:hypothetical protein
MQIAVTRRITSTFRRSALVGTLLLAGCSPSPDQTPQPFVSTGDIHQFMVWYLEPAADVLWDNAGFIVTQAGEEDLQPTDQEGWDRVRNAATVVAEGGNLLMMPGYAADSEAWVEYAGGVITAGLSARQAALNKDADALFQAGANLYSACLACHNRYIVEPQEGK